METFLNRAINVPIALQNDSDMTQMTYQETRHKPDKPDMKMILDKPATKGALTNDSKARGDKGATEIEQ